MKSNIKIILIAASAAVVGLAAGYFLFSGKGSSEAHNHEIETSQTAGADADETIYTCSMHPQIRQNEPGECPLCGMDLIPAVDNSSTDPTVLEMTENAVKLANIQTSVIGGTATSGEGNKSISLSGKVQVDERRAATQVAHISGRIEKLYVTFTGENVSKGQKLATIYSPELITAQRELLEAVKLQNLSPGLVEAARNKLRFWKIGETTIAKIEQNGKIQETFNLFADASGIITNRRVSVGDYVKQGEPLFDLMNLGKVWVIFDAYERDLQNIRIGNRIEFTSPAIPNRVFKTKISFIDPLINPKTRTASVRAEINNSKRLLKPEMFVNGTLINTSSGGKKAQLTVPKTAVLWTGKRSVIYIKLPDTEIPSFKFREVEIGESVGDNYLVISGLDAGEEVVTYGNFALDAAAQLNNQSSMMNRNVSIKKEAIGIPDFKEETPSEFKKQLHILAEAYLNLKDAFVDTNPEIAATAASDFLQKLKMPDMKLVKGDAHIFWMEQFDAMQAHGTKIGESTDVEEQRKQFGFLSEALINSLKAFGMKGTPLYVMHCPMAFGNKGADWLSNEEQIRNPYFGDKMMKCGAVKWTFE